MSSDGYSDGATDINLSVQIIPYTNESTVTKKKLVTTASCVKPGLIYWPNPSDSRRSKQMPGIKNLKNNINVNAFTIVLFRQYYAYLFMKHIAQIKHGIKKKKF